MKKFKRKNKFWAVLAVLLVTIIAASTIAYFFNADFKSKVNEILKIEQKTEKKTEVVENTADDNVNLEKISALEQEVSDTQQKLSETQAELYAVMADYSNPNILVNGDFNVCQRSSVRYERIDTDIFCCDHWQLMNGKGLYHKSNKTLECTDETNPIIMTQWVEDYKLLMLGKTLTASATINGVRYSGTALMPEKISEDFIFNVCVTEDFAFRIFGRKSSARMGVQFIVNPGVTVTLAKTKLEESTFATKYVERSTAEENSLCQRYFQRLRINATGYAKSTTEIRYVVPTTVAMRTSGTLQFATSPQLIKDGVKVSPSSNAIALIYGNCVEFKAIVNDGSLVENGVYTLVDGVVYVDAEWY